MLLKWIVAKKYAICGPLLNILSVFNKAIATEVIEVYSEVTKSGSSSAGMLVNNWLRLEVPEGEQKPNTKIFTGVDRAILVKLLGQAFGQ